MSDLVEDDERTLSEKLEKLQASYIGTATNDGGALDEQEFGRLRMEALSNPQLRGRMPDFVRKYRGQAQFLQFIKQKLPTYAERRLSYGVSSILCSTLSRLRTGLLASRPSLRRSHLLIQNMFTQSGRKHSIGERKIRRSNHGISCAPGICVQVHPRCRRRQSSR